MMTRATKFNTWVLVSVFAVVMLLPCYLLGKTYYRVTVGGPGASISVSTGSRGTSTRVSAGGYYRTTRSRAGTRVSRSRTTRYRSRTYSSRRPSRSRSSRSRRTRYNPRPWWYGSPYIRRHPHWYYYYVYYIPYVEVYYEDYPPPPAYEEYGDDDDYREYGDDDDDEAEPEQREPPYADQRIVDKRGDDDGYEEEMAEVQEKFIEIERLLRDGDAAFRSGDYDAAVKAFKKIVKLEPDNPIGHIALADALFSVGKYKRSAKEIKIALDLDPEWIRSEFDKRELYDSEKVFKKELASLEKYVKKNPENLDGRLLLAYNYYFSYNLEEAVEELDRILKADPKNEIADLMRDNVKSEDDDNDDDDNHDHDDDDDDESEEK